MKFKHLLLFALTLAFLASCKKSASVDSGTTPAASDYYFKGTLNGQAVNWQVTDDIQGYVTGSASSTSSSGGISTGSLSALLSYYNDNYRPQLAIQFRTIRFSYDQDKSVYFKGFLSTGTIALAAADTYTVGTKSLVINYTDKQGVDYTSIGAQTGNSANIVSITYLSPALGRNEGQKVKLTFSCTLYPRGTTGASLTLTNAEATVRLENLYQYQ